MSNILDKIFADKKEALEDAKRKVSLVSLKERIKDREPVRDVKAALTPGPGKATRIIAEIKPRSPFKGELRPNCDALEIGRIYERNGAAAISVLTEQQNFGGSIENLERLRQGVQIPLLRKDFIFAEYQVYEARAYGADLFLLIATWLEKNHLADLLCVGKELGLTSLVEVHNEKDVEKAYAADATLIGINNRDLTTGKTDLNIAHRLIKMAAFDPQNLLVCESGIQGREAIVEFEGLGAHAFLVGESLMRAGDMGAKLRELLGHEKKSTAGQD